MEGWRGEERGRERKKRSKVEREKKGEREWRGILMLAISNLYDFTRFSIKVLMQKLTLKMSSLVDHEKAQSVTALPNKICFAQIRQVLSELHANNFSDVNLQWLTNTE